MHPSYNLMFKSEANHDRQHRSSKNSPFIRILPIIDEIHLLNVYIMENTGMFYCDTVLMCPYNELSVLVSVVVRLSMCPVSFRSPLVFVVLKLIRRKP